MPFVPVHDVKFGLGRHAAIESGSGDVCGLPWTDVVEGGSEPGAQRSTGAVLSGIAKQAARGVIFSFPALLVFRIRGILSETLTKGRPMAVLNHNLQLGQRQPAYRRGSAASLRPF